MMARYKIDCCQPDCPKRSGECHSTCGEYKLQRKEYEETMAEKRKETDLRNGLNSFMYDSIEKTNKHINYRKKYRRGH